MTDVTVLARGGAPTDPAAIVAALRRSLYRAMKPRANGTRHLDSCRNARVNASWFDCQKECTDAQVSLVWAERYLTAHERPLAEQQQRGRWEQTA